MYTIILRRRRRCWAHCWRHRGPTNGFMGCGGVPRYRRARGVCWVVLDLSDKDYCTNVRLMIVCRRSMRGFDIIEIKMNIRTILLSITCIYSLPNPCLPVYMAVLCAHNLCTTVYHSFINLPTLLFAQKKTIQPLETKHTQRVGWVESHRHVSIFKT